MPFRKVPQTVHEDRLRELIAIATNAIYSSFWHLLVCGNVPGHLLYLEKLRTSSSQV